MGPGGYGNGAPPPEGELPKEPFPSSEHEEEYQQYKEMAFHIAVSPSGDLAERKKQVFEEIENQYHKERDEHSERHDAVVDRIESDLEEKQAELDDAKQHLDELRDRAESLKAQRDAKKDELEETKEQLDADYRDLTAKREVLRNRGLSEHLDALEEELDDLIERADHLRRGAVEALTDLKDEARDVFQEKIERIEKDRDAIENQLSDVQTQTRWYRQRGLTPSSARLLILIGLISAIASGWFMSSFAAIVGLGNENATSVILGRIVALAEVIQNSSLLSAVGWWLGGLAIVTVAAWIMEQSRHRELFSGQQWFQLSKTNGQDETDREDDGKDETGRKALKRLVRSAYATWLDSLPYVTAAGLIFIFLSVPGSAESIDQALDSAYGQIVGTMLAISFAGIILLGRTFFMTLPTMKDDSDRGEETSEESPQWMSIGFVLSSFILFLLFTLLVALFYDILSLTVDVAEESPSRFLSFGGFFLSVLATGLTIGFGAPILRVFQEEQSLRAVVKDLDRQVVGPLPEEVEQIAADLRLKLGDQLEQTAKSFKHKNNHVLEVLDQMHLAREDEEREDRRRSKEQEQSRGWLTRLFDRLGESPKTEGQNTWTSRRPPPRLTDVENLFYPDLVNRIERGVEKRDRLKKEIQALEAEIEAVVERRTQEEQEAEEKIANLKNARAQLRRRLRNENEDWEEVQQQLLNRRNIRESGARDGFHLGDTYRSFYTDTSDSDAPPNPPESEQPVDPMTD